MPTWLWSLLALRVCPASFSWPPAQGPSDSPGVLCGCCGPRSSGGTPGLAMGGGPRRSHVLVIS